MTHSLEEGSNEILSTRVIKASREQVWRAWTEPKHLAEWWGPAGFTNTFQEFDLRVGGIWRFIMRSPTGAEYHNQSIFIEMIEPERIVFDHLEPMHRFRVTATFAEQPPRTKVLFRMSFESADECQKVKSFIIEANEQNFDRLEAELAKMTS